jgi:hypothetical protein
MRLSPSDSLNHRKLAALSSLFEHLCDANAVTHNPVKGVKRPKVESYEGKTPALGDGQALRRGLRIVRSARPATQRPFVLPLLTSLKILLSLSSAPWVG